MLHFLRSLRRKLLGEANLSVGQAGLKRYLLYAIGEILLVVIGILIALQINTWNANRNDTITAQEYIARLAIELKADIQYYQGVKDQFIAKEKGLKRIIRIWQLDEAQISDSLQYINDFFFAGQINPWYNEPVTWNQLIQTGELKLIKDQKLIDSLYSHNNMVKRIADNYMLHPMDMTNEARIVWREPFLNKDPDDFFFRTDFDQVPAKDVYTNIWKNKENYLGLYITVAYVSMIQYQNIEEIISSGERLLMMLEKK